MNGRFWILATLAVTSLGAAPAAAGTTVVEEYEGRFLVRYQSGLCMENPSVCPGASTHGAQDGLTFEDHPYVAPANRFRAFVTDATLVTAKLRVCALDGNGLPFQCWDPSGDQNRAIPSGTAGFRVSLDQGLDVEYKLRLLRAT